MSGPSSEAGTEVDDEKAELDPEAQFAALKSFYQTQLTESTGPSSIHALTELGFSSPGSLSRIMSLYSGIGGVDKRTKNSQRSGMREALSRNEGFHLADLDDSAQILRLRSSEWSETSTVLQNSVACSGGAGARPAHFASDLRPTAYLLRAKRSKRCPVCRHIISKPEAKVTNTRFRIKLVAGSYIPSITIKPMPSSSSPAPPIPPSAQPYRPPEVILKPLKTAQFLLTFHNPIFENVRVTLATPAVTPGRFRSKVTVLCPEFEIDANTDVWDEALRDNGSSLSRTDGRSSLHSSRVGGSLATSPLGGGSEDTGASRQAEAGQIWERGRNWVTIVLEVVPASIHPEHLSSLGKKPGEVDTGPLREDEDVLEIPMFVRLVWEVDAGHDDVVGGKAGEKSTGMTMGKEKRELTYWSVLGIGRISSH